MHRPKRWNIAPPQELVAEAISIMSEVRESGYGSAAIALARADVRGVLDNINVPLLMIWGTEDTITPRWEQLPKGATVEMIPDAGHLSYVEQPDAFNRIVLEFLKKSFGPSSAKT